MSSNRRNQRRSALRPVRDRQEEQFKKDLKELEQLQKLDHDMDVLKQMMNYKIYNTESAILQSFNDTVELIAFKGTALIQHVAQQKMRNEQREEMDRHRERERNQPRQEERNEPREEESNQQGEEQNLNPLNLSEQQLQSIESVRQIMEPRERRLEIQPQQVDDIILAFQSQQRPQIQERFPQSEPTQPQGVKRKEPSGRAPDGRKILKSFKKYEPKLYKQLLADKNLQEKILAEMNFYVDQAKTISQSLILNLSAKNQRGRSRAFEDLHKKLSTSKMMTQRTRKMFVWPFVESVSLQLRVKNQEEQRRNQSGQRDQDHQREEMRQGNQRQERRQANQREERKQESSSEESRQSNEGQSRSLNNQRSELIEGNLRQHDEDSESDSDNDGYYTVQIIGCNIF